MKLYCLFLRLASSVLDSHPVGVATSSPLDLHLSRALWTIYRAASVPLDRLLRSVIRPRKLLTERSKKGLKVSSPLPLRYYLAVFTRLFQQNFHILCVFRLPIFLRATLGTDRREVARGRWASEPTLQDTFRSSCLRKMSRVQLDHSCKRGVLIAHRPRHTGLNPLRINLCSLLAQCGPHLSKTRSSSARFSNTLKSRQKDTAPSQG